VFGCDIRKKKRVDAAFDAAAREHGPIAALVANAGIGGPNVPDSRDRFEDLVATNLSGTYSACEPRSVTSRPDRRRGTWS
jgi:NAD(P)-dependent dehydrogenase (short-subunit alcohol dehydrogenase family)